MLSSSVNLAALHDIVTAHSNQALYCIQSQEWRIASMQDDAFCVTQINYLNHNPGTSCIWYDKIHHLQCDLTFVGFELRTALQPTSFGCAYIVKLTVYKATTT